MQPLRDWLIVGGIFAAALVIGGSLILMPYRGRVSGAVGVKATRLVLMPDSVTASGPGMSAYQWLDDKTVLIHDRTEDYALDIATGKTSTPAWIGQALRKFGGKKASTGFYGWVLSPDRKWAVTSVSAMTASSPAKLPLMLAGPMTPSGAPSTSGVPSFPMTDGRWLLVRLSDGLTVDIGKAQDLIDEPIWRPDSKGWFELDQSDEETGTVAECAFSGTKVTRKVVDRETKAMSPMTVIGALSSHQLLTLAAGGDDDASDDDDADTAMSMPYNVVHFAKGKEVVDTTYKYSFGMMSIPFGHEISPDGTRIAWNDMSTKSGVGGIILQSTVLHKSPFDMTLKVSNVDGSGMRVMASGPMDGQGAGPSNVRWMPDGKHISYIDHGALWSVPAE